MIEHAWVTRGFEGFRQGSFGNAGQNLYVSRAGVLQRIHQQVPVPSCTAVAAGDFNGDGRPDLAFICNKKLRLFYQSELGFEPKRFVDLDITGETIVSHDLDGDGYADLIVRSGEGVITIYWGGKQGIEQENSIILPASTRPARGTETEKIDKTVSLAEYVADAPPLVSVVVLEVPNIFVPFPDRVLLVPVSPDRCFSPALELACPHSCRRRERRRSYGHCIRLPAARQERC